MYKFYSRQRRRLVKLGKRLIKLGERSSYFCLVLVVEFGHIFTIWNYLHFVKIFFLLRWIFYCLPHFSQVMVICLSWYLDLNRFHEALTFIIWHLEIKFKSISSSHVEPFKRTLKAESSYKTLTSLMLDLLCLTLVSYTFYTISYTILHIWNYLFLRCIFFKIFHQRMNFTEAVAQRCSVKKVFLEIS